MRYNNMEILNNIIDYTYKYVLKYNWWEVLLCL